MAERIAQRMSIGENGDGHMVFMAFKYPNSNIGQFFIEARYFYQWSIWKFRAYTFNTERKEVNLTVPVNQWKYVSDIKILNENVKDTKAVWDMAETIALAILENHPLYKTK